MSTNIIYQRHVQPDNWPAVVNEGQLTEALNNSSERILISGNQWRDHQKAILESVNARQLQLGIELDPDSAPDFLAQSIDVFSLIKLQFAGFSDGRGFTRAVQLRDALGYCNDLRAVNVERDNLAFLEQCGFSSFELTSGSDPQAALSAFSEISFSEHSQGACRSPAAAG